MKIIILIICLICGNVKAQDTNLVLNLGVRFNYEYKGGFRNVHSLFLAGFQPVEGVNINGLIGYNKLFNYNLNRLPDTLSVDYVSLGFNFQCRYLRNYRLSPLTDLTIGTGLKSEKSSKTDLFYTGNPDLDPYGHLGKFIRVSLYASLSVMADISFDHFNLQGGGGFKFTRIHKEQSWDDQRSFVNQKNFELCVAAIYNLPIKVR